MQNDLSFERFDYVFGKPNQKIALHVKEFPIRIVYRYFDGHRIQYSWNAKQWILFNNQQSVHSTLKIEIQQKRIIYIECYSESVLNLYPISKW